MTCHTEIYGALVHIYFRNDNWESFLEQVCLIVHMRYFLKNRELCLHQDNMYLYPLVLTFISLKGGLQEFTVIIAIKQKL